MQPPVSASSWVLWWGATSRSMRVAFIPRPLPVQPSSFLMQVGRERTEVTDLIEAVFETFI